MTILPVRLGFVPTYRFGFTDWCRKMRADSLDALGRLAGVQVVAPQPGPTDPTSGCIPEGAVNTLDQGEALAEYFARQKVDGLVICPLDFGDERASAKVAEKLGLPVLLYATKEPPANADPGLTRVSDSYCGNLSIASGLYRRKIAFHYAGIFFPGEPELQAELEDFVRAVAVVKALKNARIGQVGVRPGTFETVGYDETAMIQKFGQNVIYAEVSDLVEQAKKYAADDPAVQEVIARLRADVPVISVADDHLVNSARLELALADFFTRSRLSAMGVQCWPAIGKLMPISVCALYGRLTERGMLTACETDILGALSMLVSHASALEQTRPHFIDWTIQHRERPDLLLAWHCGNAPVSLAAPQCQPALRSRNDMTGSPPVVENDPMAGLFQFQVKPGQVTFCRLAEYDNKWKMLISTGQIVPSEETLAGTWAWVAVKDHPRLYRTLVEEGFIHHASMIHGDQVKALRLACKFLDIQAVVVD